ncbi:MAG: DUF2071 domain-containing protein [Deltaproteobacteria bacterium]|nr:DUF2071 domain-containing protein [Deltaproteobacteria bacterium]
MSSLDLDRITPTKRPDKSPSGWQRWRELLFVHWTLPIEVVRPLIPKEVELDPWGGQMYVGLVPFRMEGIRPSWLPSVMAMDFLELNLRTYVHYRGRPGVWFFSLDATSWLAVQAARTGWSLPYHHARMDVTRTGDRVAYRSSRRAGPAIFEADYDVGQKLGPSEPGTLEHFLLERYLLLSERSGRILEGQVHHVPYPAHRVENLRVTQSMIEAAGMPRVEGAPITAHYSPGVDVEVFGPWPVT